MSYPELSDLLVGRGKGQAVSLGVREVGGVEVQTHAVLLSEVNPLLEVLGLKRVSVSKLAVLEDSVVRVNVDLVSAGNQRESLFKVCKQLIGAGCSAGIVTGGLNTAGQRAVVLETKNVVCLPAVHRNANVGKLGDRSLGVNTVLSVDLLCGFIALIHFEFLLIDICTNFLRTYIVKIHYTV